MPVSIAIDAMGGDHSPREVVLGAVSAARAHPELKLLLVGREAEVRSELDAAGWSTAASPGSSIEIVPAQNVIGMGDSPVEGLRKKRGSSIEVATKLVRAGEAVAMVSAGNTGAVVAAGTMFLDLLPDVRRAGIAAALNPGGRPVVVIDVGANVASKPEHLIQYAIMAGIYARSVLGVENPRIGLLNIGEEDAKGNSLAKVAHSLFQRTNLNFVGNVEGVEIFRGVCDVVVCDGFVGNTVLKVSEGLAEKLVDLFKTTVEQILGAVFSPLGPPEGTVFSPLGPAVFSPLGPAVLSPLGPAVLSPLGPPEGTGTGTGTGTGGAAEGVAGVEGLRAKFSGVFHRLRERLDYAEYGGAPLLGVKGVMIIAHGRSDSRAIANAIRVAKRMAETDVNRHITDEIRALGNVEEVMPGASRSAAPAAERSGGDGPR